MTQKLQPVTSESFHPDRNLPSCMMPDGGECCAGHAAVVADWHKLRKALERISNLTFADGRLTKAATIARNALATGEAGGGE
jgi:hypothetical protein